jgi:hypothetical protein
MPYNITNYDGTFLVSISNSSICTSATSLALIGQNAVNFGLPLNENFVYLLQNFSSSTPPASPIEGQIWYNNVTSVMNYYDGKEWLNLPPPFNGNAGTAQIVINQQTTITVVLSGGAIVSACSNVPLTPDLLPTEAYIGATVFNLKSLFPTGIAAGITLATVPSNSTWTTGYTFQGTAAQANVLATARTISVAGSATGNVKFDGSSNVTLTTNLVNVLNGNVILASNVTQLPNWFTNVYVNSNGIVSDATTLIDQDVYRAIGYTPPSIILFSGDVHGNTVSNGSTWTSNVFINTQPHITAGWYSNVYVSGNGIVTSSNNSNAIPTQGIVLWSNPALIPAGWAQCNGQTVTLPDNTTINTPDLTSYSVGPTVYIMRIV